MVSVRDAERFEGRPAHETALACAVAGIEAAHPAAVIESKLRLEGTTLHIAGTDYDLGAYDEVLVLGGGKAAGPAVRSLETVLGDRLTGGVIVTPAPVETERVDVVVGDHPVPSAAGVAGAERVLELARTAGADTLVLAVITGGGSALLPAPAENVSLEALQRVTDDLLASGATIGEINAVRKHLSAIKGGRLAAAAAPARVVGLVFSDVVGNDLSVIASGPTAPDASTFADAKQVLDTYGIEVPPEVRARLDSGADGELPETPKADDPVFERVDNHVLADGMTALRAAREPARKRGYTPVILSSRIRGEAREAAKAHVAVAEETLDTGNPIDPPAVVLSGGETTVTVTGDGTGGPNQEFLLSAAIELRGTGQGCDPPVPVVLAAVDTDGRDGATDVAGGLIDPTTVDDPEAARAALRDNDASPFLATRKALLETGPTGTNVNDVHVLVVGSPR